jgi:hypothetical protein
MTDEEQQRESDNEILNDTIDEFLLNVQDTATNRLESTELKETKRLLSCLDSNHTPELALSFTTQR